MVARWDMQASLRLGNSNRRRGRSPAELKPPEERRSDICPRTVDSVAWAVPPDEPHRHSVNEVLTGTRRGGRRRTSPVVFAFGRGKWDAMPTT
jgi:hypothetical protein